MNAFVLDPRVIELNCKTKLHLLHRHSSKVFVMRLKWPSAHLFDGQVTHGCGYIALKMLLEGTQSLDFDQFNRQLEGAGIEISLTSDGFCFTVMEASLDKMLFILQELVNYSKPTEQRFEKLVKNEIDQFQSLLDDGDSLAYLEFVKKVYMNTPFAHRIGGSVESLQKLTYSQVNQYIQEVLNWSNLSIYVSGAFDESKIIKTLNSQVSLDVSDNGLKAKVQEPSFVKQNTSYFVVKDKKKSSLVMGHLGVIRHSDDYIKLKVLDHILGYGSGFVNRLCKRLREELGLCYSIYGDISTTSSWYPGCLNIQMGTRPENVLKAVTEIEQVLLDLKSSYVGQKELDDVKSYLSGAMYFSIESNSSIARYLLEMDSYNLQKDFLLKQQSEISSITLEDIFKVANQYLHPDQMVRVVVGNSQPQGFVKLN
ncbi:MAG: insulinase family protein [Candidatus Cloacimonetes bacterium]|nr:insulinase family protein [Candidatus Cloacimonadota bacterium]